MKPRMLILLVLAGGLALYFATSKSQPITEVDQDTPTLYMGDADGLTTEQREMLKKRLAELPLPGDEPPDPPDISVQVEVDTSAGKNRLYFTLSEAHGYYVETFRLQVWYKVTPDMEPEDSPLVLGHYLDRFVKANETLRDCMEVVPAELADIDGDIGTTADWGVRLVSHGRARDNNPDPLPYRAVNNRCFD